MHLHPRKKTCCCATSLALCVLSYICTRERRQLLKDQSLLISRR